MAEDGGARPRDGGRSDGDASWADQEALDASRPSAAAGAEGAGRPGRRQAGHAPARPGSADRGRERGSGAWRDSDVISPAGTPVAFRTANGWRVGEEEVSDLTSAMVLADLLAADLPAAPPPAGPPPAGAPPAGPPPAGQARTSAPLANGRGGGPDEEPPDPRKLQETVAQLEHALRVRVRVEQAIGVLAERHRLRPRQAFELLRSAARVRGRRVLEVAAEVVDSANNPLLRIPEELARPPAPRRRGRMGRHHLGAD